MGYSESAQATDLVDIYLLYELNSTMPEIDGGLYRDDALFITSSVNKSVIVRMSKGIRKSFKSLNRNHVQI